jgi:uncharacterized protein YkwD
MNNFRTIIQEHSWKLALGLGLAATVLIIWGRGTQPESTIPTPAATATPSPTVSLVSNQDTGKRRVGLIPTATPTVPPPTATFTPAPVYYIVEPGDVPLEIAAAYSISVEILMSTNNISDATLLQIGQQLLIPVTATPSPTAPTPTPTPTIPPTATPEPLYHTVDSGETLLEIAREYDSNVELIMVVNELKDPRSLQVGQMLLIPTSELELNTPAVLHTIVSGDTFSYLSFFYGSTVDDILAANPGLDPTTLQIGQTVIIPVTSPPNNPDADPSLPQIRVPTPPPATLADLQREMVAAVNAQRDTFELPAYETDEKLALLALAHAQDMVTRGYFSHTTPEGLDLDDRFAQQKIPSSWTGENIQRNSKPISQTVAEAIRWFMNSAPHRSNLLHNRFNSIGVGVAEAPTGWYTFVLVFAER